MCVVGNINHGKVLNTVVILNWRLARPDYFHLFCLKSMVDFRARTEI